MAKSKAKIPVNITEEYYQISSEILSSFSKYRPPVDLFKFKTDIAQLYPLHRKGMRLSNEQIEEINALCENGELFVSRTDHPIYSEHIVNQVDLVLVDDNLKESEIADIFIRALQMRLEAFIDQPVKVVFENLYRDLLVFTEYIMQDKYRLRSFLRRLSIDEYSLSKHSVNCLILGVWLYITDLGTKELKRKNLDRFAFACLIHDIGMSKIPNFILSKKANFKGEEKEKILLHPLVGVKMMQKCDIVFDELVIMTLQHHERLDGSGYPQHLKGDQIHPYGRMIAVIDTLSAMIQSKNYGEKKDMGQALQILMQDKTKFDNYFVTLLNNAQLMGEFNPVSKENTPQE